MANPNILQATTIAKKTRALSLDTTSTALVDNPSSSGKVIRINSIRISYNPGTSTQNLVDLSIGAFTIASQTITTNEPSILMVSEDQSFYLTEGQTLSFIASNSTGDIIVTYTELS